MNSKYAANSNDFKFDYENEDGDLQTVEKFYTMYPSFGKEL